MVTREIVPIPNAHKVLAPLSHAVRVGDLLFVSGVPGYFGDRQLAPGDFEAQCSQALDNLDIILKAAGTSFDRIVKSNVIITRQGDFAKMNELYRARFTPGNFPARTTVVCELAVPGMMIEIECVVAL
ncbi:MAG: RidA family protein [Pseudolabrys sp.]